MAKFKEILMPELKAINFNLVMFSILLDEKKPFHVEFDAFKAPFDGNTQHKHIIENILSDLVIKKINKNKDKIPIILRSVHHYSGCIYFSKNYGNQVQRSFYRVFDHFEALIGKEFAKKVYEKIKCDFKSDIEFQIIDLLFKKSNLEENIEEMEKKANSQEQGDNPKIYKFDPLDARTKLKTVLKEDFEKILKFDMNINSWLLFFHTFLSFHLTLYSFLIIKHIKFCASNTRINDMNEFFIHLADHDNIKKISEKSANFLDETNKSIFLHYKNIIEPSNNYIRLHGEYMNQLNKHISSISLKDTESTFLYQKTRSKHRFILAPKLLELLIHLATIKKNDNDTYETKNISIDDFIVLLGERYGLYIYPTEEQINKHKFSQKDMEAFRENVNELERILKANGFYQNYSDSSKKMIQSKISLKVNTSN